MRGPSRRLLGDIRQGTFITKSDIAVWAVIGTGADVKLHSSFNVSSLTDNAVGDYTLTYQTAFQRASNYALFGLRAGTGASKRGHTMVKLTDLPTTTTCRVFNQSGDGVLTDDDPTIVVCVGWV